MHINFKLLLSSALLTLSQSAFAQMNIFACEPEYAALAKELAPSAKIYTATTAMQDPHQVQARPSLIAKMRQADLVICAGADLEIGWLPMLQMKSANTRVRSTDDGLFFAADHVETLDQMSNVDRSMGDVHSAGNPHLHFSPQRVLDIAKALTCISAAVIKLCESLAIGSDTMAFKSGDVAGHESYCLSLNISLFI